MLLSKELSCELQVVFSTILFGLSFVGMRKATEDEASPITYNAWRFIVSAALIAMARNKMRASMHTDANDNSPEDSEFLISLKKSYFSAWSQHSFDIMFWGGIAGLLNFSVSTFQQYGVMTVSAGKAAFINGLFVVVTPLAEAFLPCYNSSLGMITWIAVALSGIGTYFLSDPKGGGIGWGEIMLIMGMLSCCLSILVVDAGTQRLDCIDLTIIQLSTTAVLSTIASLIIEPHMWSWPLLAIQVGWPMILGVGFTEGFGYLFGTLGQMHIPPHRASVLFGLEGVATTLLAYLILDEELTFKEIIGCSLMLAGTLVYSLPHGDDDDEEVEEEETRSLRSISNASMGGKTMPMPLIGIGSSPYATEHKQSKEKRHVHVHPMIHMPHRRPRAQSVSYLDSTSSGHYGDSLEGGLGGSLPTRGVSSATKLLLEDCRDLDSYTRRSHIQSYDSMATSNYSTL